MRDSFLFLLCKVGQYVRALKMGWMKPTKTEEDKEEDDDTPNYYMLWKEDEEVL